MGIFFNDTILNEVYFGKSKNLIEIENCFSIIKKEYNSLNKNSKFLFITGNDIIEKNINKICDLLENEFQIETALGITSELPSANAITFYKPIIKRIAPMKTIKTKEGVKCLVKGTKMSIVIGDIVIKDLEPGEITAILLHEVGHNFFGSNNYLQVMLTEFYTVIQSLGTNLLYEPILFVMPYIIKITNKTNIKPIIDATSSLSRLYSDILAGISSLTPTQFITNCIFAGMDLLKKLVALPKTYIQISNERFADNFATSYGYGPELTSALAKLEKSKTDIDKVPIIRTLYDFQMLPFYIASYILDEHPNTYNRIDEQIKYCEDQLEKINDKKIKNNLEDEINEMKKVRDVFKSTIVDTDKKNKKFASAILAQCFMVSLNGKSLNTLVKLGYKDGEWKQYK